LARGAVNLQRRGPYGGGRKRLRLKTPGMRPRFNWSRHGGAERDSAASDASGSIDSNEDL
jgi:hypothetical protein